MTHHVYLLASRPRGALYVGRTADLPARVAAHRAGTVPGHARRYGIATLVWFEAQAGLKESLRRVRSLKRWRRAWKLAMVEAANPRWRDVEI